MGNSLKATYDPANPPLPGTTLEDDGFVYRVMHVKKHRNQKGEPSLIITWEGLCAHDGKPFQLKTGCKVYAMRRRCPDHNIGWAKAYPFGAPRPDNAPGLPAAMSVADERALQRKWWKRMDDTAKLEYATFKAKYPGDEHAGMRNDAIAFVLRTINSIMPDEPADEDLPAELN